LTRPLDTGSEPWFGTATGVPSLGAAGVVAAAAGSGAGGSGDFSSRSDDTLNHDMEKNRATRFSATSRR
jgi:hypothetical protein